MIKLPTDELNSYLITELLTDKVIDKGDLLSGFPVTRIPFFGRGWTWFVSGPGPTSSSQNQSILSSPWINIREKWISSSSSQWIHPQMYIWFLNVSRRILWYMHTTICPRSSDPFYIVSYYLNWVTTAKTKAYFPVLG